MTPMIQKGQLIFVKDKGIVPIEKLEIGNYVYAGDGSFRKVLNIRKKEHRGITTKLEYLRYNNALICDHQQLVLSFNENTIVPRWTPIHTILPGNMILMPIPKFRKDTRIIKVKKVYSSNPRYKDIPEKVKLNDELLELFGCYLAEGFSSIYDNKGKFISISGHVRERGILEKFAVFIYDTFGVNASIYNTSTNGIELRAFSSDLALWFHSLFDHGARNKKIPEFIMDLPPKKLIVLLTSYIRGDGYKRKKQAEYTTASSELAYQVMLLCLKCNFIPTLRKNKKFNVDHWVGGYTIDGQPSNKKLNMKDDNYIFHPVNKVLNYKEKKTAYTLIIEGVDSVVVGQCTLKTK